MSAARTKIFGLNLAIDPKLIVLLLIVTAGLIYYFTASSSDSQSSNAVPAGGVPAAVRPPAGISLNARVAARRAKAAQNDRGTLKLVAVDGSRGEVDPTLRLRLLDRLKNVQQATGLRNLFDASAAVNSVAAGNLQPLPAHPPKIVPGPLPPADNANVTPPPPPPFTIPLKYYGFVKSAGRVMDGNRGFFMDGENILVGSEGDVLEKHILIVALTPNVARLEDTQAKQGQDLLVTPEAPPSQ